VGDWHSRLLRRITAVFRRTGRAVKSIAASVARTWKRVTGHFPNAVSFVLGVVASLTAAAIVTGWSPFADPPLDLHPPKTASPDRWRVVTVDDADQAFIRTPAEDGSMPWSGQTSDEAIGGSASYVASKCRQPTDPYQGDVTGIWRARLARTGTWRIEIHMPGNIADRKDAVHYYVWPWDTSLRHQIAHQVDQSQESGWFSFAPMRLEAGNVAISLTEGGGGYCRYARKPVELVVFDAVRFTYIDGEEPG
jgi:hypothetical protein